MKLLDKDALVAEIEKCKKDIPTGCTWGDNLEEGSRIGQEEAYERVLCFINTLEVKEVDLEKEATRFVQTKEFAECEGSPVLCLAKHFFELGLNAKG